MNRFCSIFLLLWCVGQPVKADEPHVTHSRIRNLTVTERVCSRQRRLSAGERNRVIYRLCRELRLTRNQLRDTTISLKVVQKETHFLLQSLHSCYSGYGITVIPHEEN